MKKGSDVVILGAGAIGCSIAYHLARRGTASLVVDRDSIGSRASGKAWAVVSYPPYIFAMAQSSGSYFGMPEGESVARWQDLYWAAYFRMASLALDIQEKAQVDIQFGAVPMTLLADSERAATSLGRLAEAMIQAGHSEPEWLGATEVRSIFPGIHPEVSGGLCLPQLQVEPYRYTLGLAQTAETLGARFRHGEVVGFDTEGERVVAVRLASGARVEADVVVIAMGPWSGQAASHLGVTIPAYITMEECVRLRAPRGYPLHSVTGNVEVISKVNGDLILATAEVRSKSQYFESKARPDFDCGLSETIKRENLEAASQLLPELLAEAEVTEHRGDLLAYGPPPFYQKPVLGGLEGWENVYVATRFGGMGINMSVGVGEVVADLVVDGTVSFGKRKMVEHLSKLDGR